MNLLSLLAALKVYLIVNNLNELFAKYWTYFLDYNTFMKVVIYTPDLEVVYEKSVLFIHYCYESILSLTALINI